MLTERSWRHLVEFVDFTLQPMLRDATSERDRDRALELHLLAFSEFESLLKLTVDRRDRATLTSIDNVWSEVAEIPRWLWDEDAAHHQDQAQTRIARDRVVGRMGVALWAAHEAAREQDPAVRTRLLQMFRQVSAHLDTLDHLFLAEEWADEEEDARQWDRWFLEQLPERPTQRAPHIRSARTPRQA
ncbi:MAG TPA: hypothetical protein VHF45_07555 [Thermoleophilaceae bacterium]|nr:hypothetical protein [Thermoleophilaceae bacterium]